MVVAAGGVGLGTSPAVGPGRPKDSAAAEARLDSKALGESPGGCSDRLFDDIQDTMSP